MVANLRTRLGSLTLANPIMSAAGTYGAGLEGREFVDLSGLGALVTKTVTVVPWHGNPPQRIIETPSGMLNSIGLENKGADYFLANTLPEMLTIGPPVIVNIGGESIEDFVVLAERFSQAGIAALEVNLSCPNVQGGKLPFSSEPAMTESAVRQVVAAASVPVFAKLSPNVTAARTASPRSTPSSGWLSTGAPARPSSVARSAASPVRLSGRSRFAWSIRSGRPSGSPSSVSAALRMPRKRCSFSRRVPMPSRWALRTSWIRR